MDRVEEVYTYPGSSFAFRETSISSDYRRKLSATVKFPGLLYVKNITQ